jgi:hypothetical protein
MSCLVVFLACGCLVLVIVLIVVALVVVLACGCRVLSDTGDELVCYKDGTKWNCRGRLSLKDISEVKLEEVLYLTPRRA